MSVMRPYPIVVFFPLSLLAVVCTAQRPVITSFSPTSGPVGTPVVISGANFSTTAANDIVYFGAVKAIVTVASANSLTVTAPDGASPQALSVTINGLTGWSAQPFVETFSGGSPYFTGGSFAGGPEGPTGLYPQNISIVDFDGDGKPDLVTAGSANYPASTVSVMRNTGSSPGNLTFSPNMNLPVPVGGNAYSLAVGDIDGDGKPDIILGCIVSNTISIYRNTSTPGTISFAAGADFATSQDPYSLAVGDIDGDGRADIAVADFQPGTVSVFRNTSSPGNVSLAGRIEMITGIGAYSVAIGDVDGDGKPDLAVVNLFSSTLALFRNLSNPGNLAFSARTDLVTGPDYPFSVCIMDLDGDGKADLVISNRNLTKPTPASVACTIFRNGSSPGTFAFGSAQNIGTGDVSGLAIGDLNGDGRPDLVLPCATHGMSAYPNTSVPGAISFGNGVTYYGGLPFHAAISDLDGDGLPDVAAANIYQFGFLTFINRTNKAGISGFFPTIAPTGAPVLITGANLSGATDVQFGGVPAASFIVLSDTSIRAIVGSGTAGDLTVVTPKGTASMAGFTFAGVPTISGFSPALGGEGATVNITGTYLIGTSAVQFGGVNARSFSVLSDNSLTAVVDSGANGSITLATPGGTATATGFSYLGPTIGSYSPVAGNSGTTVTVTGTQFTGTTAVSFGGVPVASFTVVSPTTIQAVLGRGATGNVQVKTGQGQSTRAGFVFTGPTIGSFAPSTGGPGTVVTLTGTNFTGATAVTIGGTPATSFTRVDSATISLVVGSGTTGNIDVTTTLGTAASAIEFNYTTRPVITGFSPVGGPLGSSMTITGANFSSTPGSNIVYFGAVKGVVTAATANSLTVTVPPGVSNDPVTVTTDGLTAYANAPFRMRFGGAGPAFTSHSFDGKLDLHVKADPNGIQIADIDGDGKPDILVGNASADSSIALLRNTSTVGFLSFAAPQLILLPIRPGKMAIGDVDGDGRPDLAIGNGFYGADHFVVYHNASSIGNIRFDSSTDIAAADVGSSTMQDLDGDGKPDLVTVSSFPGSTQVFQNTSYQGAISFSGPIILEYEIPDAEVVQDMDGDGKPDILLLRYNFLVSYRNTSTPGFMSFSNVSAMPVTSSNINWMTAGDVDGDGKPDIIMDSYDSGTAIIYVYLNTSTPGTISFGPRVTLPIRTNTALEKISVDDMDGDGIADLVVTVFEDSIGPPYTGAVSLYKGISTPGHVAFAAPVEYPVALDPFSNKTGDLDGDGRPDIVIEDGISQVAIFRNTIGLPTAAPSIGVSGPTTFCQGDSVLLISSVVSGDQWYEDGQPIAGATSDTLKVSAAGTYTVTTVITDTLSPAAPSITITVNPAPVKPVISEDSLGQLVSSANSGNQWYVDTLTAVPGAVSRTYKPADSGYYTLRVNLNGCNSEFADSIFYRLPKKSDIVGNTPPVRITPNPVINGRITVQYSFPVETSLDIKVSDATGKVVLVFPNVRSGDALDVSSLGKGMYWLTLVDSSGKVYSTVPFIKF